MIERINHFIAFEPIYHIGKFKLSLVTKQGFIPTGPRPILYLFIYIYLYSEYSDI